MKILEKYYIINLYFNYFNNRKYFYKMLNKIYSEQNE